MPTSMSAASALSIPLARPDYLRCQFQICSRAQATRAAALIVDEKFPALEKPTLRIRNPQLAYARAVELLHNCARENPEFIPARSLIPRLGSARMLPSAHVL